MSPNSRGPILLRLAVLFFVPLFAAVFLFIPRGEGLGPALITYGLLLIGLGPFAAAAMTPRPGFRIAVGVALAVGMFLVHIVVGVSGCTAVLALR